MVRSIKARGSNRAFTPRIQSLSPLSRRRSRTRWVTGTSTCRRPRSCRCSYRCCLAICRCCAGRSAGSSSLPFHFRKCTSTCGTGRWTRTSPCMRPWPRWRWVVGSWRRANTTSCWDSFRWAWSRASRMKACHLSLASLWRSQLSQGYVIDGPAPRHSPSSLLSGTF